MMEWDIMTEWQDYINHLHHNINISRNNQTNKENNKMSVYDTIYVYYKDTALKGKLKPIVCPKCRDEGRFMEFGECETCLQNRAYNREYIETHSFIYDKILRGYHYDEHQNFKGLPLRLPDEHPYLYYGIEIEIEFDTSCVSVFDRDDDYYDDDSDNWEIQEILNEFSERTEGMFIYERDGSLDNGVECISRPTSYAYWTHPDTVKKLKAGLEFLRSKGACVKQPDSNGLHIHLSRKFFDNGRTNVENRQTAYENFDWLFQKFQPEIERLGGRRYTHYCGSKADKLRNSLLEENYTMRDYNVEAEIKCKLKKGGRLPEDDHYSAVNLTPRTIEARVFKSTTDYKEVLSYIELVRNMAHTVREENIERTLNDILHTKDNKFLDEHISKISLSARKDKADFNLDKICDDSVEVIVEKK